MNRDHRVSPRDKDNFFRLFRTRSFSPSIFETELHLIGTHRESRGETIMHEKQKPFDNEAFEPTIPVFLPLFPPLLALLLLPFFPPLLPSPPPHQEKSAKTMGSLVPTKTDISVVGTIVRGLTIDPEKEISSSHEARRPLFISPLPLVFRYPPTLFPPSNSPPSYLQRQITPFATVISLRLCSFADTPVLYSIPRDSYGSSLPSSLCSPRFPSSRNLFVSLSTCVYVRTYVCIYARVYFSAIIRDNPILSLPWHQDRNGPDIHSPLRRPKLNDLSYKRLWKPIRSRHGTIDKSEHRSAEQQPSHPIALVRT